MKYQVNFVMIEETDKDLILSFALYDTDIDIKSLTLLRTLFFEELLPEVERGVHVSLEGEYFAPNELNMLNEIIIEKNKITIKSSQNIYSLDTKKIESSDIVNIFKILEKQNHDKCFNLKKSADLIY